MGRYQGERQAPTGDNVVGEMGMRILFAEWLDATTGERAAAGWRGDRYLYFAARRRAHLENRLGQCGGSRGVFRGGKCSSSKSATASTGSRSAERSYEADAPRVVRVRQTDAHEVIVIDAAHRGLGGSARRSCRSDADSAA